jgi:hypothetical protein
MWFKGIFNAEEKYNRDERGRDEGSSSSSSSAVLATAGG